MKALLMIKETPIKGHTPQLLHVQYKVEHGYFGMTRHIFMKAGNFKLQRK